MLCATIDSSIRSAGTKQEEQRTISFVQFFCGSICPCDLRMNALRGESGMHVGPSGDFAVSGSVLGTVSPLFERSSTGWSGDLSGSKFGRASSKPGQSGLLIANGSLDSSGVRGTVSTEPDTNGIGRIGLISNRSDGSSVSRFFNRTKRFFRQIDLTVPASGKIWVFFAED